MDLGVAVVAWRNTVVRFGGENLIGFALSICASLIRITGLEESAAAAAAEIVRSIGIHIDIIFFSHNSFDDIAQIFGHRIAEGFTNQLARILNRKCDLTVLVPVGVDLEFTLPDPLGIILNDALDFKIVGDVEFFQSGPDCKKFVPSLGIEPDLALEIIHGFGLDFYNMFPGVIISKKHAVVFRRPSFGTVCPVSPCEMENLPEGHHFIRFGDRFSGILVQKELSPFPIDICFHVLELRLAFLVLLKNVLYHELEVFLRCPHGRTGIML
jgi:hypothetical protein